MQFIGAFAIILYYDWVMALFALASAPILVLSAKPLMKIMRRYNEQTRKINGEILSFNEEAFQNIQLVKAFDLAKQRCRLLKELLEKYKTIQLSYAKMSVVVSLAMGVLGLIAGYGCYGWAIYRLWTNVISYGQMTMFLQLSSNLSSSFSALTSMVPAAVSVATAAGRIMEVTEKPAETDADARPAKKMLAKTQETGLVVEARDMSFTYEDGKAPVMSHVSFKAQPGEILAFVGPSGGGKTTLASLVARDGQLRAALETADAWEFVSKQTEGLDTVLGERGVNLSEGQLQRLAIARALLREAPILIMDEATSALDVATESRVLHAVMKANPRRICLLTTHRASMLAYADHIIQVDGDGSFTEIDPTPYRQQTTV